MTRWKMMVAALPLVVIALGVARAEAHLASADTWLVDIEGYDPRDLLHGRYLRFRVKLPWQGSDCGYDEECHACLMRDPEGGVASAKAVRGRGASSCDGILESKYVTMPHRFYIPEARARQLEKQLREAARQDRAQAEFAISADGRALIKAVRLHGKPITR
jgi:uncharacterized membrane-anchored protein